MPESNHAKDQRGMRDAVRFAFRLMLGFFVWGACYFLLTRMVGGFQLGAAMIISAMAATIIMLAVRIIRMPRGYDVGPERSRE